MASGVLPAARSSDSIHVYVRFSPSSSLTCGSHPTTVLNLELSLLRPRTPCGLLRSCRFTMYFPAASAMRSTSSSTVTRRSVPRVQRLAVARVHDPEEALHAVVDVHEGPRLLAVSPHLDLAAVGDEGDLAANGCRGLFSAALIGAERTVDVVEPSDAGLDLPLFYIVLAQLLRI